MNSEFPILLFVLLIRIAFSGGELSDPEGNNKNEPSPKQTSQELDDEPSPISHESNPSHDHTNVADKKAQLSGDGDIDKSELKDELVESVTVYSIVLNYLNILLENFIQEFSSSIGKTEIIEHSDVEEEQEERVELSLVVPEDVPDNQNNSFNQENTVINATSPVEAHSNVTNDTLVANNTEVNKYKFHCIAKNITDNETASVKILNGSTLLSVFQRGQNTSEDGACVLVLFYTPWCPFSAKLAPHYNALGRAFGQIDILAINAMDFSYLNVQFGTVAVPHVILFRNSRPVMRFNSTHRTFDNLVSFIVNMTGLQPNASVNVTEMDYFAPLASVVTRHTDYLLVVAWLFVVVCTFYIVTVSHVGQRMIHQVRVLWHEHQHID